MCSRTNYLFIIFAMVASAAFLGIVGALTIDNQLAVDRNDCYERLAIGQRLNPKNVYKTFNYNTLMECEMACTKEKNSCKAFSFGIETKENATCELSIDPIKETADLKPIGTITDTNYDLYIKKLGCSVVVDKIPHDKLSNDQYEPLLKPDTLGNLKPDNGCDHPDARPEYYPLQNEYGKPPYGSGFNNNHYLPQPNQDDVYNVQTLVSVANGPQSFLHPVHDILIGDAQYAHEYTNPNDYRYLKPYRPNTGYDEESHMPPFRPPILHHPYETHKPKPDDYDRPDADYGSRPNGPKPGMGYDNERPSRRPYGPVTRPDIDKNDNYRPFKPSSGGSTIDRDYDRPPNKPSRPHANDFDNYDRPVPNRYGSLIPHPNDYDKRPNYSNYFYPPENDNRPIKRPHYDRPENDNPNNDYDRPSRPPSGSLIYDDIKPNVPNPYLEPQRPVNDGYGRPSNGKPFLPDGTGNSNNKYSHNNNGGLRDPYNGGQGSDPKRIVTHSTGYHGEHITSIITEVKQTCFRRVLAGKRVARRCVKRALTCETVDECQRECADEKRFTCEGFNYRLDPTGRGKGECELLDVPLSQLDIGRDLYPDPDYDYYERDRNAASVNCKQRPGGRYPPYGTRPEGYGGYGHDYYAGGHYSGSGGYYQSSGGRYDYNFPDKGYYPDRRHDRFREPGYKVNARPSDYDTGLRRPGDRWPEDDGNDYRRQPRPGLNRRYNDYPPEGNRRGDYSYHHSHSQQDYENSYHYKNRDRYDYQDDQQYSGIHYLPAHYHKPFYESDIYDYKSYEPYLPPNYYHKPYDVRYDSKRYQNRNKDYWGVNNSRWGTYGGSYGNFGYPYSYYGNFLHSNRNRYDFDKRNYYLPPNIRKDWGLYGGTYGYDGGYHRYENFGNKHSFNYWGFNKFEEKYADRKYPVSYGDRPPNIWPRPLNDEIYVPKPPSGANYLPLPKPEGNYLPVPLKPNVYQSRFGSNGGSTFGDYYDNSILPAEPRRPPTYNFIKDECSLRSAGGFRLHKRIVKKFYAVPNIYECELLCFREKDFLCSSYAYRYTISLAAPTDNCYLSNRSFKDLDYYIDLEPDRDFDVYTMNNRNRCEEPIIKGKDNSDCFWRVRSGQRLDQKVVRDSLTTKSIVECQIECLRSIRFTCRAFSFRYGSPVIGGAIDNCQLTDWPFYELDPRAHFIPESGFEVYDRGSFGHGCEPDHFQIRGQHGKDKGTKVDQLCYIGFGSPARFLPQATRKSLRIASELDCKAECSKAREGTLFQCMSFSFRKGGPPAVPNCYLSDILQRDLLPNVDYVYDPDSWLFAWDNYNPECIALSNEPLHSNHIGINDRHDIFNALDTWRVYSVSGWPCRRGSLCQQNRETGFWFCELEGGGKNSWDYCCRPDHQCGASNGYPYQWCYVGPAKTQWRKCSDRYYPYIHNIIDKLDHFKPPRPGQLTSSWTKPPVRPGLRPDRPPAPPLKPPPRPSLDEYEMQFDNEFLDPPKPGGFGQPRRWPVSYLHKDMPPNSSDSETRLTRREKDQKHAAIQNLINVIKNNDLNNVQYHISNSSNKEDDILFVKIPLPTNFSEEVKSFSPNRFSSNTTVNLQPVYLESGNTVQVKRAHKSLPFTSTTISENSNVGDTYVISKPSSVYRRGFVTRTNITAPKRLAYA